jgi:alkyl sulfatase BDS1-like metallo-beta-lactamase superfamily hydrolase
VGQPLTKDVTTTITMSRQDLAILTSGKDVKMDGFIKSGKMKLDGDAAALKKFLLIIDNFEFWFNIIEP